MSKTIKTGDVFYIKVENKDLYVFGRVLFDVKKQLHKVLGKNFMTENYHPILGMFYENYQLVEMYEGIFKSQSGFEEQKVLIPRVLVSSLNYKPYNSLECGKIKNIPVDYTKIEFPESVDYGFNHVHISRGELILRTNLPHSKWEEINMASTSLVPRILLNATLDFNNRRDLIPEELRRLVYLKDKDLYYNQPLRNEIYNSIGIDPEKSYYELSKDNGFDLARFYE